MIRLYLISFVLTGNINLIETRKQNGRDKTADPQELELAGVIQTLHQLQKEIAGGKDAQEFLKSNENEQGNLNYEDKKENFEKRSFDANELSPSEVIQMLREFMKIINEEKRKNTVKSLYKPQNTQREFSTDYIDGLLKRVASESHEPSDRQRNRKLTYKIYSFSSPDLHSNRKGIKSISDPVKNLPRLIQNLRRIEKNELGGIEFLFRENDVSYNNDLNKKKGNNRDFIPAGPIMDEFDLVKPKKSIKTRQRDEDNWNPNNEKHNNRITTKKFDDFINKPKRFDDYGSKKREFKPNNILDRNRDSPKKDFGFNNNNERNVVKTTRKRDWDRPNREDSWGKPAVKLDRKKDVTIKAFSFNFNNDRDVRTTRKRDWDSPNREDNWDKPAYKPKPNSYRVKPRNDWESRPKSKYNHAARGGSDGVHGRTAPAYHGKKHIYEDEK